MNPIRRILIKLGLLPITPADLAALLDQARDTRLHIRARLAAWLEYAVFTQSPEQLETLLDTLSERTTVPVRPGSTDRVVS